MSPTPLFFTVILFKYSFGTTYSWKSFQLIVLLVPSFAVDAISVTIIGILLGPMFPTVLNHTARVLPRHLVNSTVGWISACGAGGNTFMSYITGEMASKLGIESLQILCVCGHPTLPPVS